MAKSHWVDDILADARAELQSMIAIEREALTSDTPIGMRRLTKQEQTERFLRMSPEEHQQMRQEREDYPAYVEAQVEAMRERYGDEYANSLLDTLMPQEGAGYMNPPQSEM
jgi:phosphoglycolate phosphatase-like HAD superfamily hydrolase